MYIYNYIYINEPEIGRLYAQSNERVISERLQANKKVLKGGVSAKVMGAGIDVGGDKETETIEKEEITFPYKLRKIKEAIASSNNLYYEIGEVFDILKVGQGVYIDTKIRFTAPQFKEEGVIELVNQEGSVILESKIEEATLIMSLGLCNMTRLRTGVMSRTCHDAIIFREIADNEASFSVFGLIRLIRHNKFQIRPITVALP